MKLTTSHNHMDSSMHEPVVVTEEALPLADAGSSEFLNLIIFRAEVLLDVLLSLTMNKSAALNELGKGKHQHILFGPQHCQRTCCSPRKLTKYL
jgi:hypothetical protein